MADLATLELAVSGAPAVATVKQFGDASEKAGVQATGLELAAKRQVDSVRFLGQQYDRLSSVDIKNSSAAFDKMLASQQAATAGTEKSRAMLIAHATALQMDEAATRRMGLAQTEAIAMNAKMDQGFTLSGAGLGRLRQGFTSLAAQLTGTNALMDRTAATFGSSFLGTGPILIAIAAVAALAEIWKRVTADATAADKAMGDAATTLIALRAKQRGDDTGDPEGLHSAVNRAEDRLRDLATQIAAKQKEVAVASQSHPLLGPDGDTVETAVKKRELEALQKLQTEAESQRNAGNRGIQEEEEKNTADAQKRFDEAARVDLEARKKHIADITKLYRDSYKAQEDDAKEAARQFNEAVAARSGDQSFFVDRQADEERQKQVKAQDEAYKVAMAHEVAETQKATQEMERFWSSLFDNILKHGLTSFRSLFDEIKAGFEKLIADLAAKKLVEKFGTQMAGMLGIGVNGNSPNPTLGMAGLGAAAVGFGAGYTTGEALNQGKAMGALVGAASGAAAGAALGSVVPVLGQGVGAIVGGITGLIGGFLGAGDAAKKAAEQTAQLRDAFSTSFDLYAKAVSGQATALDSSIAQIVAQKAAYDQQIEAAYAGTKAEQERNGLLQENADLETKAIALARTRQAEQDGYDTANLAARALAAAGDADAATALSDATAQQKEYNDAVNAGKDATYLAQLAIVQQMEETAKAITKVKGVIDGFTNTIAGLQSFKDSLALSDAVSPTDKLAAAQKQYQAVVDAAGTGDQAAAGRLPTAAQTLLDAAKAVYASGPEFQAIYSKVNADTDAIIKYYQDQRSIAQQQLDALLKIQQAQQDALKVAQDTQTVLQNGTGGPTGGSGVTVDGIHKGGAQDDATLSVLSDGFTQVVAALGVLQGKVDDNTAVTRNGFEGQAVDTRG